MSKLRKRHAQSRCRPATGCSLDPPLRRHSSYARRFNLAFPLPRNPQSHFSLNAPPIPHIILPGNHDLGLHLASPALAEYARERFAAQFGPLAGEQEWGGWSVVWVDSMGLLEEGESGEEARGFVEGLRKGE